MRNRFIVCLASVISSPVFAQSFLRTDTIPVIENSVALKMPWTGGLNHCQFSDIDIDLDGKKDLVAFDRTGNKLNVFISKGTAGQVDYVYAPQYASLFPHMENWALMIDYNCDGKEDIFTYNYGAPSSIRVYKNTSTATLQFTLVKTFLESNYNPGISPIYVSSVGLPAIEDIDGDGDLDVLMFVTGGWTMDYHINQSVELGYSCDSLLFTHDPGCWGHFTEVSTTCSAALASCKTLNIPPPPPDSSQQTDDNGGSCLLCLDMDDDGDKELYLGQLSCCRISLLTNGGTPSAANMTALTADFPNTATPVNFTSFPCAYFVDVNNDTDRDLIVSSSMQNSSTNTESTWYYENTGTDSTPVFARKTRKFLQEDMIDVGEGADPAFFDFDSDGRTDLLISNYDRMYDTCPAKYTYNVSAYKNTGTASAPKFTLVNTDYASLSAQLPSAYSMHLTFGDVDNDGDEDLFVGDYNGFIHFLDNTAGAGNPANFVLSGPMNYTDAAGSPIDIGSYATPQLVDADRDGDLDMIIGERSGNLNYYQNIGTPSAASYSLITTSFGGVDAMKPCCTGYSVPFLFDSLGSYRLLVASEASKNKGLETGWIWYFTNIDGNLGGNFSLVDSMYQNIWEGSRMTITGKDITNDGFLDLVIGNYAGGVAFYLGDTTFTPVPEINPPSFDFSIAPNPSPGQFSILLEDGHSGPARFTLKIYNTIGECIFRKEVRQRQEFLSPDIPGGIYFCELSSGRWRVTKKLAVIR